MSAFLQKPDVKTLGLERQLCRHSTRSLPNINEIFDDNSRDLSANSQFARLAGLP